MPIANMYYVHSTQGKKNERVPVSEKSAQVKFLKEKEYINIYCIQMFYPISSKRDISRRLRIRHCRKKTG